MAKEEIITRKITIEVTKVTREFSDDSESPKKDLYHWLEKHIVKVTLVTLTALGAIMIIGAAIQHTYHVLW